jgi:hypothetical protein
MKLRFNEIPLRFLLPTGFILVVCIVAVGLLACVHSVKPIVVGRFELNRRDDGLWSYREGGAIAFSASGKTLQTGQSYSFGPFRVTRWTRDWRVQ